MNVHVNIEPIDCLVESRYLYDMDESISGYMRCTIYALSSYRGHVLTAKILLKDGSLFDYIPLDAFIIDDMHTNCNILERKDLIYNNCPTNDIVVNVFSHLTNQIIHCYFKNKNCWLSGRYILTVDWFTDNLNAHLILLSNGQFALLPNHKIKVGDKSEKCFSSYKKLHCEFKL